MWVRVAFSDRSWVKFTWIECERDFSSYRLCEMPNPWMTIYSIFRDFEWKTCQLKHEFTWNHQNYENQAWIGIHNIELKCKYREFMKRWKLITTVNFLWTLNYLVCMLPSALLFHLLGVPFKIEFFLLLHWTRVI